MHEPLPVADSRIRRIAGYRQRVGEVTYLSTRIRLQIQNTEKMTGISVNSTWCCTPVLWTVLKTSSVVTMSYILDFMEPEEIRRDDRGLSNHVFYSSHIKFNGSCQWWRITPPLADDKAPGGKVRLQFRWCQAHLNAFLLLFLLISLLIPLPHRADKLKIRFRIINLLKNRLMWQLLIIYDLTS